jgi:Spy/CpxP family protein refolding chaperone
MKKTILAAVAGALVATTALALTAFGGGPFRHRLHDPAEVAAFVTDRVDDALDDLDATPAQRTQINAVKERMLSAAMAHRGTRQETRDAFLTEWKAEKPDAARLHALVDQRAAEMTAMAHQAVDAGLEVHDTLTAEQRAKVTKKAERFGRHFGHGGRPGPVEAQ